MHLSAPSHSASLLQGLAALRAQGQLLDVVLTINREAFHAHKVVLAACSDYFRAMFTGGMREASQDVIELKGVSARGLRHIIDFAYSAEVTLDLDCVQDVLGAAVFLQMLPVVELCEEFLKAAMSVETCLHIGQMATAFSLASLRESVDAFTFRHFLQIAEEEDFLRLPLERLVFFLQSNRLQSCAEIDLFRAAVRWLQHDPARRPRASHVLCHIRFPLMQSSELVDSVQTLDIMVEDVLCRQYLLEAFNYQVLPFRQHEMQFHARPCVLMCPHWSPLAAHPTLTVTAVSAARCSSCLSQVPGTSGSLRRWRWAAATRVWLCWTTSCMWLVASTYSTAVERVLWMPATGMTHT